MKSMNGWKIDNWKFMRNFLNADNLSLDTPIYRIMPEEYLLNLFKDKKNVLVKPSGWDDPYENFILKAKVQFASGEVGSFGFHDDYRGQCWTLNEESDAMWRIYSKDKNGIRVKTTIGKLLKSLHDDLGSDANGFGFIGKVKYYDDIQMLQFGNSIFNPGLCTESTVKTLLVKRLAFKHEEEVRLILVLKDKGQQEELCMYSINPHDLVEKLMLDPRLSDVLAEKKMTQLKKLTKFTGNIERSSLYAPPKNFVFPVR